MLNRLLSRRHVVLYLAPTEDRHPIYLALVDAACLAKAHGEVGLRDELIRCAGMISPDSFEESAFLAEVGEINFVPQLPPSLPWYHRACIRVARWALARKRARLQRWLEDNQGHPARPQARAQLAGVANDHAALTSWLEGGA